MRPGHVRHPDQLPWFAAGRLDRADSSAIERHVHECDACRAEVSALRSMYRSIHAQAPSDHVSPASLVAYHAGDPRVSENDRRLVERHVRECHTCSADLAALARADAPVVANHGRRFLGVAASVLVVVTAGWQIASWRAQSPSQAIARVSFPPAQRGTVVGPRLTGAGPWELEVGLPLRVSASAYRARIYRTDEPSRLVFETIVAAGPKSESVLLSVPSGVLRPGHHELSLNPTDDGGFSSDVRGFDVLRSP